MDHAEPFDLEIQLNKIEQVAAGLKKIPNTYIGPQGTKIPDIAWYVLGAIKKTTSLSHAFCLLVRAKNTLAAAALIRLQLDTALRISGFSLVDDVEAAGTHLMNDGKYSDLKSRDNERLHDKVLHRRLDQFYPGLSAAYEATSGYVHLSGAHINTGLSEREGTSVLFFHLNGTDESATDDKFAEIVDSFEQATRLTADMIEDFMRYKYSRVPGARPTHHAVPPPSGGG